MSRSASFVLTMVRSATTTTTTSAATSSGRLDTGPSSINNIWKRGHVSRGSVGDKIQVIPGFKTSAAFLSSLGANLRISDDDLLPSPLNSPSLRALPDWHHNLPQPSHFAIATMSANDLEPSSLDAEFKTKDDASISPLDSIPPLTYEVADEQDDLIAGLKLVADSVAQQRQAASRILIFHPLNMAVYIGVMALLLQYFYKTLSDLPLFFTTGAGITMAFLVTIRWFTGGYLFFAEEINWDWLGDDQILITKFGEEIIGAAVLRWEKGEGRGNKKKKGRGVIRAWTVGLRFRGKGVGTGLLEEVVKNVEKRGGDEVVFAEEHANSKRILYNIYNGAFDRKERRARQALQDVIEDTPNFGGRKK